MADYPVSVIDYTWKGAAVAMNGVVQIFDIMGWDYTPAVEECYRVAIGSIIMREIGLKIKDAYPNARVSDSSKIHHIVTDLLKDEFGGDTYAYDYWPIVYVSKCDLNRIVNAIRNTTIAEIKRVFYQRGSYNIYSRKDRTDKYADDEGYQAFVDKLKAAAGKAVWITRADELEASVIVRIGTEKRTLFTDAPNNTHRVSDCGIKEDGVKVTVTLPGEPTEGTTVPALAFQNKLDVPLVIYAGTTTVATVASGKTVQVSVSATNTVFRLGMQKIKPQPKS